MKNSIILALAAVMLGSVNVNAQQVDYENRHEFAISYGSLSNSQYFSFLEDAFTISYTGGACSYDNENFVGPISAEYFYRVNEWLGVGGIGIFGTNGKDIFLNSNETKLGTERLNYFTLMPAIKADWFRRNHFGMYSKLGIGATMVTTKQKYDDGDKFTDSAVFVNWQLSLIGLEAGGTKLRAFGEFGFGEQGVFVIGLRYKI